MNRVDEKVALVTGGGSGIGEATCKLLAQAGSTAVVADIDVVSAQATAYAILDSGGKASAIQHDVTNIQDWKRVTDYVLERYKKLDVLVNNAGIIGKPEPCKDMLFEDWRNVMSINLDGVFLGAQCAINAMINNQSTGSIINISSVYGLVGGGNAAYVSSKGGVRLLTKSLAAEFGRLKYNIRVNSVHPGLVNTKLAYPKTEAERAEEEQQALNALMERIPMKRHAEPIEIARGVLFLASDDSSYMTGSELVIDGGYTAI